jgi:capsular exopolysaccharide synthesis family protein
MSKIADALKRAGTLRQRHAGDDTRISVAAPPSAVEGACEPQRSTLQYRSVECDPVQAEKNCILTAISDRGAIRAYKILRTRVLQRLQANDWDSFVVTGTAVGEGKTLTAINLALAISQDVNTRVCLVDLDLHRPNVAKSMGLPVTKGLSDYLLGSAALEEIMCSPSGVERLVIIPGGHPLENSSELLTSPEMINLVTLLRAETPKRVLIFDMPPLMTSDDVVAFAPNVDSILLVVAEGSTDRESLRSAKELLAERNVLGVVLNQSVQPAVSPYY